jgi:hypothetical protein
MPREDINEAIRLARILIEKLDALGLQMAELRAILRGETTQTVIADGTDRLAEGKLN